MDELEAKPAPKPAPDNHDVLNAIAALSQQITGIGNRLKPVTNNDVLSAVHGVSQQINSIQLSTIVQALEQLRQEIQTMSGTLEEQLQAGLATISSDMEALAADLAAIATQLTPGSTITQADIDALNAAVSAANNVKASADAMANPPAPAP